MAEGKGKVQVYFLKIYLILFVIHSGNFVDLFDIYIVYLHVSIISRFLNIDIFVSTLEYINTQQKCPNNFLGQMSKSSPKIFQLFSYWKISW